MELRAGREVELGGVGGGVTQAFVHDIATRFDPGMMITVPFAIMTSETVPNLLGRLGVFDVAQVHFDVTFHETQLLPPWLDQTDRRIWDFIIETETHILQRWPEATLPDTVRNVARRFLERTAQVLASIRSLLKEGTCYGAPALVRTLFELAWQFEYMMKDPEPRAKQYTEFYWITRYKQARAWADNPVGLITRRLAESPLRAEGEKRNRAEFERVKAMFMVPTKDGGERLAGNWYKMPTRELAALLEREAEYRLVYASASAWAHGDPFRTEPRQSHELARPDIVLQLSLTCYERLLLLVADAGRIMLSSEQYEVLRKAMRQIA